MVDDDPTLVQLVGKMLAGLGEIRFATSGEAALKVADREAPDLILLDAQMDGIDGFEVCERLKLRPEFADVPILFVTANDDEPSELRGFAVGAADFIHKPVREPCCAPVCSRICGSRRWRMSCATKRVPTP